MLTKLCVPALLISGSVAAYPISPRTLVTQVQEAELVVVAKVDSISELEEGDRWDRTVAHLSVVEAWKGSAPPEIDVPFSANLVCPAPPRYIAGQTVLAFLSQHEGKWRTNGLSYGTLYPADEEWPVLKAAARAILAVRAGDAAAHTAMLVELARHPATRWDGLFELAPEGDSLHNYYRRLAPQGDAGKLTAAQLATLAAAFVSEPSADQSLAMELAVLRGREAPAFDRSVAGVVDALLELDRLPWWFAESFDLVVARLGRGAKPPAYDAFSEPDVKLYREAWAPIRRRLESDGQIPKIKLPSIGAPGVGRRTPS